LFFTNNYGSDKNEKLTIYFSTKNAKGEWAKPQTIPFNNDKYNVTHPFFDEKNKMLYFSSDMPGGMGGMDIGFAEQVVVHKNSVKEDYTETNSSIPNFYSLG
jgi:hypothetical protein